MSESKARLQKHVDWLVSERDRLEGDVVFLLQGLMDIADEHPEITLPEFGNNRFPERVWRKVRC